MNIRIGLISVLTLFTCSLSAQDENNPITTATPFLTIAPDSRSSGMGDIGVSTSPDFNSQYWNASKYPFATDEFGFTFSYTPWLKALVNDIGLFYLAGHYKIGELQSISSSLKYFSLGDIQWTDDQGEGLGTIKPNEFAFDLAYARKFSSSFSGAVTFRFIYSDLTGGVAVQGSEDYRAGRSFAADMSVFHTKDVQISGYDVNYNIGWSVVNLGNKLSYNETEEYFLPTTMRLGTTWSMVIDEYNKLAASIELSKLLVPTPPVYFGGTDSILQGMNPDVAVLTGAFQSFYDAPGGAKEELQEIMWSAGLEYTYDNMFFIRGGYYHENQFKGNRTFYSAGLGFKLNVMSMDVSYLIPTDSASPLANTLRFSLSFGVQGLQRLINGE
jgi:hypothetical protein